MAPRSWKTEFNFNQESSSVFSSDTSKDLDQCLIVSKIDFYFPNTEVAEFYQICLSYLRKEKHIELLDSGIFSLNDSPIHWIKYSDPNDTLCAKNTNLELFYFGTPGIKNFKIKVHGEEKIEERLCEGYQLFLANQ